MSAPDPLTAPRVMGLSAEGRRSDERSTEASWRTSLPARQQVFSADLVSSAICIFEQRLGRSVSDGEARMLLTRLVDFVRLGVDGSEGNSANAGSHGPAQPEGQERGGGCKSEGR